MRKETKNVLLQAANMKIDETGYKELKSPRVNRGKNDSEKQKKLMTSTINSFLAISLERSSFQPENRKTSASHC